MSVQLLEDDLAAVLVAAYAREGLAGIPEDLAHVGHLEALLVVVRLVDAYRIDPEEAAPVPAGMAEDVLTIAAHLHPLAINEDDGD